MENLDYLLLRNLTGSKRCFIGKITGGLQLKIMDELIILDRQGRQLATHLIQCINSLE